MQNNGLNDSVDRMLADPEFPKRITRTMALDKLGRAEDVARTCHAHPSLNEAVKEAALAVGGRALHL